MRPTKRNLYHSEHQPAKIVGRWIQRNLSRCDARIFFIGRWLDVGRSGPAFAAAVAGNERYPLRLRSVAGVRYQGKSFLQLHRGFLRWRKRHRWGGDGGGALIGWRPELRAAWFLWRSKWIESFRRQTNDQRRHRRSEPLSRQHPWRR